MRSRPGMEWINSSQAHQWALEWLLQADLLKARGTKCTAVVVWSIVLRAAARCVSIFAACQDLAEAPSGEALFAALMAGLPKTLSVLERRLNQVLTGQLPRRLKRRSWQVAIDYHMVPYYGQPEKSRNELCRCKAHLGTTRFHCYATLCILDYGQRYTLALTWVRKHESPIVVLRRLLNRVQELKLKIKRVLLDRFFFRADVMAFLQQERKPFLMPVVIRGRKPKRGRPRTGLRWIEQQKAGSYKHTIGRGKAAVTVSIYVSFRTYRRRGEKQRRTQKLLFAAWRTRGTPTEIRERYRERFGIETSYRQRRQARIYTCTRNPHLRLLFVAISLMLRNLWVWIHATYLQEGSGDHLTLHLERLRFKRLLDWINQAVIAELHDAAMFCVDNGK